MHNHRRLGDGLFSATEGKSSQGDTGNHDPDSNRNYDSTIALKGPNSLKVQGCAFGGMFCGGQTWKRVS